MPDAYSVPPTKGHQHTNKVDYVLKAVPDSLFPRSAIVNSCSCPTKPWPLWATLTDMSAYAVWDELQALLTLSEVDVKRWLKEINLPKKFWLCCLPSPVRATLHNTEGKNMVELI